MERKEILSLTMTELAKAIREQKVTSEEAVQAVFENIDEHESVIHACLDFYREDSMAKALAADALVVGNNRRNCLSLVAYDRGGRVLARNYALFNYVPKGFTIRFR